MTWTASDVARLLACPGSACLPQHTFKSSYADAGTEHHAEIEAQVDAGEQPDGVHPEIRALFPEDAQLTAEAAFAYDVATDTARGLGHLKRKYVGLSPYERPGTIDLLVLGEKKAIVVDHKSYEAVDDAEQNAQLATYGLMVARAAGFSEVTVAINYKLRAPDIAVLDEWALDAHAQRLKELEFNVARARENPEAHLKTGRHCKYCPAFLSCSKQQALRLEVASGEAIMRVERMIPFNDDAEAARALEFRQQLRMLLQRVDSALYARASERPIPLPDGKMFGPVEKPGNEKLDGDVVYEVVKAQHGQSVADAAVVRSATKKRLHDALSFVAGKGQTAALERKVLDVVREKGGAKRESKVVTEVYEPQKLLKVVG